MNGHLLEYSRLKLWILRAAPWTATVLIAMAIGELRLLRAEETALLYVLLAGALAVTAGSGLLGQSRDRARRLKAALDAYAEREIARTGAPSTPSHRTRHVTGIVAFDES